MNSPASVKQSEDWIFTAQMTAIAMIKTKLQFSNGIMNVMVVET